MKELEALRMLKYGVGLDYSEFDKNYKIVYDALNELKKYKETGEYFGIDLIVFAEALSHGITYYDVVKRKYVRLAVDVDLFEKVFFPRFRPKIDIDYRDFPFDKYKIEWGLTEEELL